MKRRAPAHYGEGPSPIVRLLNPFNGNPPVVELRSGDKWKGETVLACQEQLRRLAKAWLDCGYSLADWKLRDEFEDVLSKGRPQLGPRTPAAFHLAMPLSDDSAENGRMLAVVEFLYFLISPQSNRLGQCAKCGKYFLAKRRRPKLVYCTPECGRRETARDAMRRRRAAEHQARLKAVTEALRQYVPAKRRIKIGQRWKMEVAIQASKLLRGPLRYQPIKAAFITRALNAGDLELPPGLN
jgi:hypothetical protein